MSHSYEALKSEYERLISIAHIRPECEHVLEVTGRRLLHDKPVYAELSSYTGVPIAMLMALAEREMSGNLHCYLGNGQRLTKRTTIVPIGRGPFPDTKEGFIAGARDALAIDHLDQVVHSAEGWTMPRAAFESEDWNGWGYRSKGIPTPYAFGGTTAQRPGKYIRDHVYSATTMDPQLGTIAILEKLFELDQSLVFGAGVVDKVPPVDAPSIIPVMPHPVMGQTNIRWVQDALNKLKAEGTPLVVDGDVGRATRAAVRAFEVKYRLTVDRGYPGPQVARKLTDLLAEQGIA
jgi:lysozyme family protein